MYHSNGTGGFVAYHRDVWLNVVPVILIQEYHKWRREHFAVSTVGMNIPSLAVPL